MFESIFGSRRLKPSRRGTARRHTFRPWLETLENRLTPAVIDWTTATSGNFNVAANWTVRGSGTHQVPGAADDAVISPAGITVTVSEAHALHSLMDSAHVAITGGVFSLAADSSLGTLDLSATLLVTGGTTTLTSGGTLAGTLDGGGTVAIHGGLAWTAGAMQGGGTTTVAADGTVTLSGSADKHVDSRTLNIAGTFDWGGAGNIETENSTINNTGTFTLGTDRYMGRFGCCGQTGTVFLNSGTVRKTTGTTSSQLAVVFDNTGGTVAVDAGIFLLSSGTSTGGTYTAAASSLLDLTNGGTQTYTGTYTGSGAGTVRLGSGAISVGVAGATFHFSGNVFQWTGGTITGFPLTNAGSLTFAGGDKVLSGITFTNSGTVTWAGGNINFENATINNNAGGIFRFTGDSYIGRFGCCGYSGAVFNNSGTVTKTSSLSTGTTDLAVAFNNMGSVSVGSGVLQLDNGGLATGGFDVAAGATLTFTHAGYTWNAGVTTTGAGTYRVDGAALTANGAVTLANLALASGTQGGNGTVMVSNAFTWTGGTLTGAPLTSAGTLTISGTGDKNLDTGVLTNNGTANWTGGNIRFENATINNSGAFNFASDQFIGRTNCCGYSSAVFSNTGTVTKTSSVSTGTTDLAVAFYNLGTVNVRSGVLQLDNGGVATSGFDVAAGATLTFTHGTYTLLSDGMSFTDDGTVLIPGAVMDVEAVVSANNFTVNGGALTGSGYFTVGGTLTLSGGSLGGSGTVEVDGTLNWIGGSMVELGYTTIPSGATLNISGSVNKGLDRRTINNYGTANWMAGEVFGSNGAVFNNALGATFNDTASGYNFRNETFNNAGTIIVTSTSDTGSTDIANFNGVFNSTGLVQVTRGGFYAGDFGTMQGAFTLASGTKLYFYASSTLGDGTTISGDGVVVFYDCCGGRVLTVTGSVTVQNAELQSGTLAGSGTLEVTNSFNWTGGTLASASGTLNLDATSTLTLGSNAGKVLDGRTVNLFGTATWSGGPLSFVNGAVFNVQPGATFNIQAANYHLAGNGTLINQGSIMGLDATGSTVLDGGIALRNQNGGSISGLSSALEIDNFGQSGDTSYTGVASGASLTIAGNVTMGQGILAVDGTLTVTGNLTLQGGALLVGSGTVTVNGGNGTLENMAGTISPGGDFAAGMLTIRGNFTNDAQGTVNLDIGGTNPGSGYDQLSVSGRITLNGGTANVTFLNSYAFTDGDRFNVLVSQAGMFTGDLATYTIFNLDPNYRVTHAVNGGGLVLTVSALDGSPGPDNDRGGRDIAMETAPAIVLQEDRAEAVAWHDGRVAAAAGTLSMG